MAKKQFIGGRLITKAEAYKGLGDPKTWEADRKRLERESRIKRTNKKNEN